MPANLLKRGTLLIPSGPTHDPDRLHLHIICTDPDDHGRQLVVSCNSIKSDRFDRTCLLYAYEHPNISHPSYIAYRHADIVTHERLIVGVRREYFHPKKDLNSQTFLRVTKGIVTSPETTPRIKNFFFENKAGSRFAA